ncbi:MFS transporter [Candidatus Saccharibacteria bacterium]|nr:MFS transporter [Candidatus Saccharibacteria bacterium]
MGQVMDTEQKKAWRGLRLILVEVSLGRMIISMPIMVLFFNSIGMNQSQIALSQSAFSAVMIVLSVPIGRVADRFSRRWCKVIGNFGVASSFLFYATVQGFHQVILAEILLGVFMGFSQGADEAMTKGYSEVIDHTGKLFAKRWALMMTAALAAEVAGYLAGPAIGSVNFRLAIGLTALPGLLGGVLALFMHDVGEKLVKVHANPLRDMWRAMKVCLGLPKLRWWIVGVAVTSGITHVMVWPMTIVLLAAGVPASWLGVGWVVNTLAALGGTRVARLVSEQIEKWEWLVVLMPMLVVFVSLAGMMLHLNLVTVWLFTGLGFARGWTSATVPVCVQKCVPKGMEATAMSLTKVARRLLFIPAGFLVGVAADVSAVWAMGMTLIIFVPLGLLATWRIWTFGK